MTPFEKLKKEMEAKRCPKCKKPYKALGLPLGKLILVEGKLKANKYKYLTDVCTCWRKKHAN